jgi:hypothetical protein
LFVLDKDPEAKMHAFSLRDSQGVASGGDCFFLRSRNKNVSYRLEKAKKKCPGYPYITKPIPPQALILIILFIFLTD